MTRAARASGGAAALLRLAAAPTFSVMAVIAALAASPTSRFCMPEHGTTLGGMVLMYLLMSAFHTPPWLDLVQAQFARSSA